MLQEQTRRVAYYSEEDVDPHFHKYVREYMAKYGIKKTWLADKLNRANSWVTAFLDGTLSIEPMMRDKIVNVLQIPSFKVND